MKFLLLISVFFSFSILFVSHPMSLGFILLMQTMITSFIINFLNFNFWFSYILFLVMIGGMLILFIYMTSIASNEKFLFSNKLVLLFIICSMTLFTIFFMDSYFSYNILNNFETYKFNSNLNFSLSMNKFFNFPNYMIFYISIIYLLITLIAVVKISNLNMGPLRPKN
nr:NADH dehydrogenase subunit 6 [Callimerus nigroapicalis]